MSDVPSPRPTARARRTVLLSGALGFLAALALIATLASFGGESGAPPAPAPSPAPARPPAAPPSAVQVFAPLRPGGPPNWKVPDRRMVGDGARPLPRLAPARAAEER